MLRLHLVEKRTINHRNSGDDLISLQMKRTTNDDLLLGVVTTVLAEREFEQAANHSEELLDHLVPVLHFRGVKIPRVDVVFDHELSDVGKTRFYMLHVTPLRSPPTTSVLRSPTRSLSKSERDWSTFFIKRALTFLTLYDST